jgi:hypothetical protein
MKVQDPHSASKGWWMRLQEMGDKRHEMPAHKFEAPIEEHLAAAEIRKEPPADRVNAKRWEHERPRTADPTRDETTLDEVTADPVLSLPPSALGRTGGVSVS